MQSPLRRIANTILRRVVSPYRRKYDSTIAAFQNGADIQGSHWLEALPSPLSRATCPPENRIVVNTIFRLYDRRIANTISHRVVSSHRRECDFMMEVPGGMTIMPGDNHRRRPAPAS